MTERLVGEERMNRYARPSLRATSILALLVVASVAGAQLPPPAVGSVQDPPALAPAGDPRPAVAADAPGAAPAAPASTDNVSRQVQDALAAATFIDDTKLRGAENSRANWITHGRNYFEQRYSQLAQINSQNVQDLTLAWTFFTGQTRSHEATPIALDGVLYFTSSWSIVFAVDARTGAQIWRYDPQVPAATVAKTCCDAANRGVAVYKGRIFAASLDGRLLALDAKSGKLLWETLTVDSSQPYTIPGAPRIVKGKVVIGSAGGEFGVRGCVSAYHPDTGELLWRTWTVPGDPASGADTPTLLKAAETWKGSNWWENGGGATVSDAMAFDPRLDLLYVGTGAGSPWPRSLRSPGGGDNLYVSSILALRPDTGEIVWHYQTTPADSWGFDATQSIVLADLTIEGKLRKVLMQAPENGFFYVLDRETGKPVSASNYVETSWATSIDKTTARPVEVPGQDYRNDLALVKPGPLGGHNWQPMSFNPQTGLVYFAAQEIPGIYRIDKSFQRRPGAPNTAIDAGAASLLTPDMMSGFLLAWDPVRQKEVWRHPYTLPWNGGTLTTAGNLVFEGSADGRFLAFDALTGKELWETRTGTGTGAGPITYEIDGKQYVTVLSGWGGEFALAAGEAARLSHSDPRGRVLTYTLALPASPLPSAEAVTELLDRPGAIEDGGRLYHKNCAACHGAAGVAGTSSIPDLRTSKLGYDTCDAIVRQGLRASAGMPNLGQWVSADDTRLIKAYLERRAAE